jgi:hypothetical protein
MLSSEVVALTVIHTIWSVLSVHWAAGDATIASQTGAMHPDLANHYLPNTSV